MFYRTCPQAPIALISGISAVAGIATITDARVAPHGQLFLEVLAVDELPLTMEQLDKLAEYCETDVEGVRWSEATVGTQKVFVVSVDGTTFNFDHLFDATSAPALGGDSEESWQAAEALAAQRSS